MSTVPFEGLPMPEYCVVNYFFHQGQAVEITVYNDDLDAVAIQGPHGIAPMGAQRFALYAVYPGDLHATLSGTIVKDHIHVGPLTLPDAPLGLVRRLYRR
jgi:hypothetical protein